MSHCSADRISEPEKMERQRKIGQFKEKLKNLHDQDELAGQQISQFQQAVYTYKEDLTRLK